MNIKPAVMLLVGGALVGGIIGYAANGSKLDGRLSACQEIMSMLNQTIPLELNCEVVKGDVYITTPFKPGVKVSLDGTRVAQ